MVRSTTAALVISLTSVALAGCNSFQPVTSGTEASCATVKDIVADYPAGFAEFRGSGNSLNMVTIYKAKKQLIKGHCEIWEWGNGDTAYTCNIAAPEAAVAESLYSQAATQLSECLGPEWRSEIAPRERDGKPAGERTKYTNVADSAPSVSLHRVEDLRQHSVYLYIGTPSRSPQKKD